MSFFDGDGESDFDTDFDGEGESSVPAVPERERDAFGDTDFAEVGVFGALPFFVFDFLSVFFRFSFCSSSSASIQLSGGKHRFSIMTSDRMRKSGSTVYWFALEQR